VAFTLLVGNKGKEETTGVINTGSLKRDIDCRTRHSSMQVSHEKSAFPVKVKMRGLKGLARSCTRQDSAPTLPPSLPLTQGNKDSSVKRGKPEHPNI